MLCVTVRVEAQSCGTVQWGAGNGYPYGPYATPNAVCALRDGEVDNYSGWYGPGTIGTYSAGHATIWQATPMGGYPGSEAVCDYTVTLTGGSLTSPMVLDSGSQTPNILVSPPPASCPAVSPKDAGSSCALGMCGDPVVMSIGNKIHTSTDYQAPGLNALQFVRVYNSRGIAGAAANFQSGWMNNYATSITPISASAVAATRPDGKVFTFYLENGVWTADADVSDTLVPLLSGSTVIGWQYTNAANDSLETYDAYGNLSSIAYREGTLVTLTYATGSGAPTFPGQLLSVTDSFGKSLTFSYLNNYAEHDDRPGGGRLHVRDRHLDGALLGRVPGRILRVVSI